MRVQLVCEQAIVSGGLRRILTDLAGEIDFLGVMAPTRDGFRRIATVRPDFVVVALTETSSTLGALGQLLRLAPDCHRIVYTAELGPDAITRLLDAGAGGILHPGEQASEWRKVLRAVAAGRKGLSPLVRRARGESDRSSPEEEQDPVKGRLTPREREILARLADGQTSKEIAHELGISSKTVDTHRRNVQRKLGAGGLADLVKHAIRSGLTTLDP